MTFQQKPSKRDLQDLIHVEPKPLPTADVRCQNKFVKFEDLAKDFSSTLLNQNWPKTDILSPCNF